MPRFRVGDIIINRTNKCVRLIVGVSNVTYNVRVIGKPYSNHPVGITFADYSYDLLAKYRQHKISRFYV